MTVSNQEFFNKAVAHLRAQKAKCNIPRRYSTTYGTEKEPTCVYFKESDVTRCAIGGAIPLELAKELGQAAITAAQLRNPVLCVNKGVSAKTAAKVLEHMPEDIMLASALQHTHDDFPISAWEEKFRFIASIYDLTYIYPES